MQGRVLRGKRIIYAIISVLIVLNIISIVMVLQDPLFLNLVETGIGFILTIFLVYYLYKGHNWARLALVFIYTMATTTGLISIFQNVDVLSTVAGIYMLAVHLCYLAIAVLLIFSPSVSMFLQNQLNTRYKSRKNSKRGKAKKSRKEKK